MPIALPQAIRTLLADKAYGHVVTLNAKGQPRVTMVWMDVDGDEVLFNTAEGRKKTQDLRRNPRVIVSRTFSKAYGMAGLRLGYAIGIPETLRAMRTMQFGMGANVLALKAAVAALGEPERIAAETARNTAARQYTMDWFRQHGFEPTDSQCNFIFVNIGRPASQFREGCAQHGVIVGRDFPPYEKSHVRISVGTMAEMQKAVQVFEHALSQPVKSAA